MDRRYEKSKIRQGFQYIIGCDEVGRGSLAGPVVAAAVAFDFELLMNDLREVKDSKLLLPGKRKELSEVIKNKCLGYGIGLVENNFIDEINIHQATFVAMQMAISKLVKQTNIRAKKILIAVDGKFKIPKVEFQQEAIIDGDNKIFSIAAASILAKVYRDELMEKLDCQFPIYNFKQHKGYGTFYHRKMIKQHGLSHIHRVTFCDKII